MKNSLAKLMSYVGILDISYMKIMIVAIVLLFSFTFLFTQTFAQTSNLSKGFGIIVYQSGTTYYAQDTQKNSIIGTSQTSDIVIKSALDRSGDIYIAGGTYYLSSDFSGFDLKSNTHLKLAQDANIIVPSGYKGYVFRFDSSTIQSVLEGGNINEASPVERNWIGILMQGGAISFDLVENMVITNPLIVINLNTYSPNYISANTFYNINGNSFVRGIEFDFTGKYISGQSGFISNTFRDLQFQSGPMTAYGVKDIRDHFNAFYNVIFYDLPANAVSANIGSTAEGTIIIGGSMTYRNFEDSGSNTIILDDGHTQFISDSTVLPSILKATAPQVNLPTPTLHQVMNMSIIQQAASDFVKGDQGQLVIPTGESAVVNIFGTVANPTGGSVLLSITRPDKIVEQNQADVTSDGAFYYPMTFDKNSLTGQYRIDGTYHNSDLGSLFLNVTSDQVQNSTKNIDVLSSSESNTILVSRIKNDAKLWSQGEISNDVFLNSIQYLVKIGVVKNPNVSQTSLLQSSSIPTWLKNTSGWWADGKISDSDFISGIQYLLNKGIIPMPSQ